MRRLGWPGRSLSRHQCFEASSALAQLHRLHLHPLLGSLARSGRVIIGSISPLAQSSCHRRRCRDFSVSANLKDRNLTLVFVSIPSASTNRLRFCPQAPSFPHPTAREIRSSSPLLEVRLLVLVAHRNASNATLPTSYLGIPSSANNTQRNARFSRMKWPADNGAR